MMLKLGNFMLMMGMQMEREPYFSTKSLIVALYLKRKGARYLSSTSRNNEHTFYFLDTPKLHEYLEELKNEVRKL